MGYLNNQVVTIDAILTKKGRELLAKGDGSFKITQFALSDDEIDYTLYNPSHPSGSAFFGEAIENMPILEAFPDETQIMKYKLATLPRGTAKMPILDLGQTSIILKQTAEKGLTPQTLNYLDSNQVYESSGYTFTISDIRLFSSFEGTGIDTTQTQALNSSTTNGTNVSKTVIGTTLTMRATGVNTLFGTNEVLYATLTIVGRDSGARLQIPVSVNKTSL
tara:strand:- start:1055 stop:1714 length:660 start_codon:yes stop_codon:yes gene_type:complete